MSSRHLAPALRWLACDQIGGVHMPVKRRKSKMRAQQLSPEVFAAFDAGDEYALRRSETPAMARIAAKG